MLLAHNLAKRFGARLAFKSVSFEVASGHAAAVVGRNGAGKSTLLRLIAGLVEPSAGTIQLRDDKTLLTPRQYRARVGLFAPDAPVYRELSALENLQFFARARGLPLSDDELRAHLQTFGLETRARDLGGELSSGLRARLGFAVATLGAPQILLLDEPSANLDTAGRELVRATLQQQRERGLALLATNDARDLELCDVRIELS